MQAYFNFSRFKKLVFSHWTEYKKRYLLFVIALFGIMFFGAICILLVDGRYAASEELQYALFHFCWITSACIFSGTFLSNLNDKSKGITYILLPTSIFEKFLCTLLYTIPVFFIVFTLLFYIIDIPYVALSNYIKYQDYLQSHSNNFGQYNNKFEPYKVISLFYDVQHETNLYSITTYRAFLQFFFVGLSLQAYFLMGSAFFKKFAFVKTILSAFVIMLFFTVYTFLMVKNNHVPERIVDNYFSAKPFIDSYYWICHAYVWYFKIGLGILFYIITFFHMKEKEI